MPISNYPNGFPAGLTLRNVPLAIAHPGNVYWVDSGEGSDTLSSKGTFQRPFASVDYAIGRCTANNGDIVFVKPGHVETVNTAAALVFDVAGVAVIGLGTGALRPHFRITSATSACVTVSASDCALVNARFSALGADLTRMVDVAGTNFLADALEFVEGGANLNWVDVFDASGGDNTADGLTIVKCRAFGVDAACDSFLEITGDIDRLTVEDCLCVHDHANATAFIEQATGKDMTNVSIKRNEYHSLKTTGDILIDNDTTANSGTVAGNIASHADTAAEVLIDADGVGMFNNYATGVITASGYLQPAVDS